MQGVRRPIYAQRLTRDIADLLSHDFSSSSAIISVYPVTDVRSSQGSLLLAVCILEGPYRGGHFTFVLEIPDNYPFHGVDIWSKAPVWHPNIDVRTGKVALPLTWSPVLSLISIGIAIQMIMLEPSSENPLNVEACSYYCGNVSTFDSYVQHTLRGCCINGCRLPDMSSIECHNCCSSHSSLSSLSNSPESLLSQTTVSFSVTESTRSQGIKRSNDDIHSSDYEDVSIRVNQNNDSAYTRSYSRNEPFHMNDIWTDNTEDRDDDGEEEYILQSFKKMRYEEIGRST